MIFNDKDVRGNWIPLRLEVGSWVTLVPVEIGHGFVMHVSMATSRLSVHGMLK